MPGATKYQEKANRLIYSVVFSYWTSTLDLIEEALIQSPIKFTRFDGNTSPHSRNISLKTFRHDSSVSVILMTISCASVG